MKALIWILFAMAVVLSAPAYPGEFGAAALPTYNFGTHQYKTGYAGTLRVSQGFVEGGILATNHNVYAGTFGFAINDEASFGGIMGGGNQAAAEGVYVSHTILSTPLTIGAMGIYNNPSLSYGMTLGFRF